MSLRGFSAFMAATVLLAGMANATVVLTDGFAYPDGNLVGQGPWLQTSTVTTNPIQVTSSKAVLQTSGQDVYAAFTSSVPKTDGNSIFTSFKLNLTTAAAAGDYFLHLSDPVGTTGNFYQRFFGKTSGAGYVLGVNGSSGGTTPFGTTVLNFNTEYTVVVGWNFVAGTLNDTFNIYINPTDPVEANNTAYLANSPWSGTGAEPAAQLTAFNLRQGTAANAVAGTVDDVAVATSFADVVPEPASLGLLAMSLLGLRRRRR